MTDYFKDKAPGLDAMGFRPIPIVPGTKRPAIANWPSYELKMGDPELYRSASVGVLCGQGLLVVDGDIYDPDVATKMRSRTKGILGFTLERVGAPPKFAMLYRMDPKHSTGKIRTRAYKRAGDPYKASRMEFLGNGNYLVTHGVHPDTQREYAWPQQDLIDTPFEQLALVTPELVRALVSMFEVTCVAHGMVPVDDHQVIAGNHRPSTQGQHAADEAEALALIATLPNDGSYDEWIRVGHAIKGALGDTAEGVEAWLDFSSKYEGNDLPTCLAKWDSFRPKQIGMGTLKHLWHEHERKERLKTAFTPIDIQGEADTIETPRAKAPPPAAPPSSSPPAAPPPAASGPRRLRPLGEPTYLARGADMARLVRPGWLVKGVLRRGSIYTMTAHPGGGKTTLASLLAACVMTGKPFAGLPTRQGQVMYLAADDFQGAQDRLQVLQAAGYTGAADDIWLAANAFDLTDEKVQRQLLDTTHEFGGARLLLIDTYLHYMGQDMDSENDNLGASRYLRTLQKYTRLVGQPTVIVMCHPRKGAQNIADELVPRGGSAALAATDGNIAVWQDENGIVTMHHSAKMRGAFDELHFKIERVPMPVPNEDGEIDHTVRASFLPDEDMAAILGADMQGEDRVLAWLVAQPKSEWSGRIAIEMGTGLAERSVRRYLDNLVANKLVRRNGQGRNIVYQALKSR